MPSSSDSKSFDRYAYVSDNPICFNDPSGHRFSDRMTDPVEKKIVQEIYQTMAGAASVAPRSCPVPQNSVFLTQGAPLWQIIQYGKETKVTPYKETAIYVPSQAEFNENLPLGDVVINVQAGQGMATRFEDGQVYQEYINYLRAGVEGPITVGGQLGTNKGLYFQAGENVGVQIAYPDSCVYTPLGETGISTQLTKTEWVLTTDITVAKQGGYTAFGIRNTTISAPITYEIFDQDYNKGDLLLRWKNREMQYTLKEIP